jgi:prefoldin subunit 5
MASQQALATNNAILSTVEILTAEVKQLKELITALATTVTTLKTQNGDLKQGQTRLEQQIQRMGRQQRDSPTPKTNTTTQQATGANTQPVNNRRTTTQPEPQPQPQPQPNASKSAVPEPEAGNTWAKVASKGAAKKETIQAPPKKTERTIVVHRTSETANDEADIHHMRDTINMVLKHNKAPANLLVSGIQWNRRGNLTLTTVGTFTEEELAPYINTIKTQIERFDQQVSAVGKQETWTKVIVHKVDLGKFADSEVGMKSLQTELETFNEGLVLASTPRYLTRPENRMEKTHSSCVIAMKDKSQLRRLLKYGITIFGRQCKTEEYFSARPTDQCTKCQNFGHHPQRCTNTPVCGICADPHHDTRTHNCLNCNSRYGCEHKPAKCANCGGKHRSNSRECETLQAIRNPKPEDEPIPDAQPQEEL